MVTLCSVKGCKSKTDQGIKFHRLPKGEIRKSWITFLKKHNPLFMPTSCSTNICGLHFSSDSDYEITPTSIFQTERLKKNAIPTIMNQNVCKSLLNKSNQKLNLVLDHNAEEVVILSLSDVYAEQPRVSPAISQHTVSPRTTVQNTNTISPALIKQNISEIPPEILQNTVEEKLIPNNKRKCFMGDFKHPSDIDCPNNRLKYWIASQSTVTKQKNKIKFLYKQTIDLKKKNKEIR